MYLTVPLYEKNGFKISSKRFECYDIRYAGIFQINSIFGTVFKVFRPLCYNISNIKRA